MKDTKVYRVRRKSDGLFAKRKQYGGGVLWSKKGTVWTGINHIKNALQYSLKKIEWDSCEIVEYEVKEVETAILNIQDIT